MLAFIQPTTVDKEPSFFIFLDIKIKMEQLLKMVENFRKFGKII